MIVKRYRSHKVNTGQGTYESMDFGATVEWDTTVDGDIPEEEIAKNLEEILDVTLDNEVDRVLSLPSVIKESHVFDFYEKE